MQNFLARNPFDITKATDLSDEEIQLLWVDMPASGGFEALAKPTSPMPMMVLGGKGSGKTHLLRYYSFAVQKLRHSRRLLEGVKKDGFVGVYVRCGGLNYSRFSGKGQSEEVWNSVFAYYVDLWLAYGVLSTIAEVLAQSELEENEHEAFCRSVCSLFTTQEKIECSSLNEILALFDAERKNLDARINNAALTRT
ncbi:MAG: hypothetical protein U9Q81_05930, partial [Pseudomonadota bacterium]|nr:hypothetical protein [Pseudomonadota bacterium]